MQKFAVHKVPTIDEIDELVGLNILPANFIENLLPLRDNQQHENSDEETSQPEARIKKATILEPINEKKALLSYLDAVEI